MNIPSMPFDGFNLIQDICQAKNIDSDAHKLLEESKIIFKIIHSANVNNKELANRLDSIKETFLKCTKENVPDSELSLEEKINLKYAFRDVLDQVNVQMHQCATDKNSEKKGPTGFIPIDSQITLALYVSNLAFKALMYTADFIIPDPNKYEFPTTEKDVIKKVQNILISIEHYKRFDSYEAQLKEKARVFEISSPKQKISQSVANFFSTKQKQSELQRKQERSFDLTKRCIEVKTLMDNEHIKKTQSLSITPPLFDWEGLFDPILDNVYNALLDCEKALIAKALQPYTPRALFEGKNLAQLLSSTIDTETLKINKFLNILSTTLGESVVQDFRKRLAHNLRLITEDYNLARFTVSMNTHIAKLFFALDSLPVDSTPDDLIKALNIKDSDGNFLTVEKYMSLAHKNMINNVCKLCCIEAKESDDTVGGFLASRWKSTGNAALEKTTAAIIKKAFNIKDLKEALDQVPLLPTQKNPMPGWEGSDKINKHMDVILLVLANELISEMAAIASEARKAERNNLPTDVSGITDEKAVDEVKKSTLEVVKALRNLTLPTANDYDKTIKKEHSLPELLFGGLTNHLAFSFIDYVVNMQGEGHMQDIMTPLYTEFIKKWTAWVSEE